MRLVHLSFKANRRHSDRQSTFEKLLPGNAAHITALRVRSFMYFNWNRNYSDIAYFAPQFQFGLVIVGFNIRPSIIQRFDGSRDGRKQERQVREQQSRLYLSSTDPGKAKVTADIYQRDVGNVHQRIDRRNPVLPKWFPPPPPRIRAVVQVAVCVDCVVALLIELRGSTKPVRMARRMASWMPACLFSYSFLLCVGTRLRTCRWLSYPSKPI